PPGPAGSGTRRWPPRPVREIRCSRRDGPSRRTGRRPARGPPRARGPGRRRPRTGPPPVGPARSVLRPSAARASGPPRAVRNAALSPLVRVSDAGRRVEVLLDRTRAGPAQQVEHRAGLVVRPGRSRAAERLLADHGAGGPVVEVEVPGGE